MKNIVEKLNTPVNYECDVLVAGGGIAGVSAAIAAARRGARVTLIERSFQLGGLATSGLVTIYLPICDGMGRQVSFGIAEELLRLSVEHGWESDIEKHVLPEIWLTDHTREERAADGKRFDVQFNPHLFVMSLERVLRELGVRILYGATAVATSEKDGRIEAVIIESKSGREAITVDRCVVDATGDADLCQLSSAKTAIYSNGNTLAAWYYFTSEAPGAHLKMHGFTDVDLRGTPEKALTKKNYTGIDVTEVSEMVCESHAAIEKDILARREKGETVIPSCIASIPQLRMTRRLKGLYELSDEDMHKPFEDSVGMVSNWRKRGPVYEIPFRTLRGAEVKNLLCAGRCISVTDAMWDITRVIPDCAVTGEAAGTAAAMTDDLDKLDISKLQATLVAAGVVLHESDLDN